MKKKNQVNTQDTAGIGRRNFLTNTLMMGAGLAVDLCC
jgi:hypothetical protein